MFNSGFGKAIRVDRLDRRRFGDRDFVGESIDRGAAAEDESAAGILIHGCEQVSGAGDVDIPVQERLLDRLANRLKSGEMDDGIEGTIVIGSV